MKEVYKIPLKKFGIYHPLQSSYRYILDTLKKLNYRFSYKKYRGDEFTCNFCGASYGRFGANYPSKENHKAIYKHRVIAGYGENVFCPNCLSKNRERLVKDVLDNYVDFESKTILHFSPEKNLHHYLKTKANLTAVDIEPGFYRSIDASVEYADATKLDFGDESFDIIIANHILEHIPEDLKAMKEIFRVIKRGGVAVLQAPWSELLETTIEEPYIDDPTRQQELFGQKDHVRIYTLKDYVYRLTMAGFQIRVIPHEELVQFKSHAIQENEPAVLGFRL